VEALVASTDHEPRLHVLRSTHDMHNHSQISYNRKQNSSTKLRQKQLHWSEGLMIVFHPSLAWQKVTDSSFNITVTL